MGAPARILYDLPRPHVARITISNPDLRNALVQEIRRPLYEALMRATEDAEVRAVVLTGEGKAFCAGGDLQYLKQLHERGDPKAAMELLQSVSRFVRATLEMPKPVIAAVHGAAAGAGCNLALACDLRVASEDAKFVEAFIKLGLVLDWGGSWSLPRLVGPARAAEMAYTGRAVDARTALAWGLVNRVVPADKLQDEALDWAAELARGPAAALAEAKRLLARSRGIGEALEAEAEAQAKLILGPDAGEGIVAFLEKREPDFLGAAKKRG